MIPTGRKQHILGIHQFLLITEQRNTHNTKRIVNPGGGYALQYTRTFLVCQAFYLACFQCVTD